MSKLFISSLLLLFITSAFAQKQNFGILEYTIPEGYEVIKNDNVLTYYKGYDPVTWETTGHSLSAKAGKDKEFEITKNIGGKIGASVETTIKFDGNMNPVDLIVKGAAGAEINGPMGGSAGVDLGSVTISVNGGFNTSGPGFTSFGSDFLRN